MCTQDIIGRRLRSSLLGLLLLFGIPAASLAAEQWTLNFKDAEIQELIRFVADATDLTIIVDPQVKGKIQVVSHRAVGTDELYDLFLSILEVHGYAAIRAGDVVRVVPQKDARALAVPVAPQQSQASRDNSEIVTQVVPLDRVTQRRSPAHDAILSEKLVEVPGPQTLGEGRRGPGRIVGMVEQAQGWHPALRVG